MRLTVTDERRLVHEFIPTRFYRNETVAMCLCAWKNRASSVLLTKKNHPFSIHSAINGDTVRWIRSRHDDQPLSHSYLESIFPALKTGGEDERNSFLHPHIFLPRISRLCMHRNELKVSCEVPKTKRQMKEKRQLSDISYSCVYHNIIKSVIIKKIG